MKKYEGLLDEKLDIEEKLKIVTGEFEVVKDKIKEQDDKIDHLKGEIEK